MDRWVQRQLGQEGERLQRLRERLWRDIPWTRRDRVLLLGMRSLIWAIDPLRATPEGGVTVLCDNEADRNRLEAQLDLLEPEHRPQLLTDNLDTLSSTQAFDWIGGRLAAADLQKQNWTALLDAINRHSLPTTGLRLLLSRAELGPAGALQQNGGAEELLGPVVAQEQRWLELQQRPEELLANAGWQLSCDDWLEPLTLPGGKELADRWLAEGSPYRQAMGEIKTEVLAELRRKLNGLGDGVLRLPMRHQLIKGNRITP